MRALLCVHSYGMRKAMIKCPIDCSWAMLSAHTLANFKSTYDRYCDLAFIGDSY